MRKLIIAMLMPCLLLVSCGSKSNVAADANERFTLIVNESHAYLNWKVVVDNETGCEYLTVSEAGLQPLNDEFGRPVKGCKGVSKVR